jgi:dTDP-4-dehydrorhamnose reductase
MKVLIVGASGYIGEHLYKKSQLFFESTGTSSSGKSGLTRLDLDSLNDFNYSNVDSETVVLFAAAISSPDICEKNYEHAWNINVKNTIELIRNLISFGCKVIFFSSDTVYGEQPDLFDESAKVQPLGEYAKMKNEVEQFFKDESSFKTIRLSYVFSKDDKFTNYLLKSALNDEEAEIFHPFYRSIIYRDDVVDGVFELAKRWAEFSEKEVNFGGLRLISRVDLALLLRKIVVPNLRVRISKPDYHFFQCRPKIISMKSPLLLKLLGRTPLSIEESIFKDFNLKKAPK